MPLDPDYLRASISVAGPGRLRIFCTHLGERGEVLHITTKSIVGTESFGNGTTLIRRRSAKHRNIFIGIPLSEVNQAISDARNEKANRVAAQSALQLSLTPSIQEQEDDSGSI